MDPRVERIVAAFEALSPADLQRLDTLYTADASFKDPFNEVQGVPAIRGVFEHMYRSLDNPRFVIHERIVQGDRCFLTWDFVFRLKRGGARLTVRGGSHLQLSDDGRIAMHRDYWDVAEELYEKLPLLGGVMRWLKRRVKK
jgi:steroid Delta-isomerase